MAQYIINGGRRLEGRARVGGAKNAILPVLAAVLLTERQVVLYDCPKLLDVFKIFFFKQKTAYEIDM